MAPLQSLLESLLQGTAETAGQIAVETAVDMLTNPERTEDAAGEPSTDAGHPGTDNTNRPESA